MTIQRTISPVDGSVYVERELAEGARIEAALATAEMARAAWRVVPVVERQAVLSRFVDAILSRRDELAQEITWQMGRPIAQSPGELKGFEERARYMIRIAEAALADIRFDDLPGFARFIRREPLGTVFVVAPWNYPYLTAVNSVVPALLAGNAVILKHSAQTPLVAERFAQALDERRASRAASSRPCTSRTRARASIIADGRARPRRLHRLGAGRHARWPSARRPAPSSSTALELGGKDPAYVRADANLQHAIENLVDGAFFNSGQCCCGIERIYVHETRLRRLRRGLRRAGVELSARRPARADDHDRTDGAAALAELVREQIDRGRRQGRAGALVDRSALRRSDAHGTPTSRRRCWSTCDHAHARHDARRPSARWSAS